MSDKITGNNTGAGAATDGNGGNNMNTDQTGQSQGGGSASTSQGQTKKPKKKPKNNDSEYREKLSKSFYPEQAKNWYENIGQVFGIETIKKMEAKTDEQKEIKQEALNNVQTMSFKLTQSLIGAVSTAVNKALAAGDNRYKKK
jgi:hypothetical protein